MLFLIAASSVDHALDTLNPENQKNYNEDIFFIPGPSLNPITKNPQKIAQNLLSEDLAKKTDINLWHDVLNNRCAAISVRREIEVDSESDELTRNVNAIGEVFRPLLNINRRENSDMIVEKELKTGLNSRLLQALHSAIDETVLPVLQNTLGMLENWSKTGQLVQRSTQEPRS